MQLFEMQPGTEHRKHPRLFARAMFPKDIAVVFRMPGRGAEFKATLHGISEAGLFLQSKFTPPIGVEISLVFLFGGRDIRCQARVIHLISSDDALSTPGFGLKFTRLHEQDYLLIKAAVDECTGSIM